MLSKRRYAATDGNVPSPAPPVSTVMSLRMYALRLTPQLRKRLLLIATIAIGLLCVLAATVDWSPSETEETQGEKLAAFVPPPVRPLRAVVLFLEGGKPDKNFTVEVLPRIDKLFFRHYPHYTMRVFHEGQSDDAKREIASAMPLTQHEWAKHPRPDYAITSTDGARFTDVNATTQLGRMEAMAVLMDAAGLGFVNTSRAQTPQSKQKSLTVASPLPPMAVAALQALKRWVLAAVRRDRSHPTVPGGLEFQDVKNFWEKLPHGVTEEEYQRFMEYPPQAKERGRGYRLMCRFWAGIVWQLLYSSAVDDLYRLVQAAATALRVSPSARGAATDDTALRVSPSARGAATDEARAVMEALAIYERSAGHDPAAPGSASRLLADTLTFGGRRVLGGPLVDETGGAAGGNVFLQYDYYWRLDTDSVIRSRVRNDPFQLLFGRNMLARAATTTSGDGRAGCVYALNALTSDNEVVTEGLYDFFLSFLQLEVARAGPGPNEAAARATKERVNRIITNVDRWATSSFYTNVGTADGPNSDGGSGTDMVVSSSRGAAGYGDAADGVEVARAPVARVLAPKMPWDEALRLWFEDFKHGNTVNTWKWPAFFNNFEMGTLAHKQTPLYRRWFDAVDRDDEIRGILRYRWGDAPLHTHVLFAMEDGLFDRLCHVSHDVVDYLHGFRGMPPLP